MLIVDSKILLKLVTSMKFDRLFYLRVYFDPSDSNVFGNSLATLGPQLRALLLGKVDSRVCICIYICIFGIDEHFLLLSWKKTKNSFYYFFVNKFYRNFFQSLLGQKLTSKIICTFGLASS